MATDDAAGAAFEMLLLLLFWMDHGNLGVDSDASQPSVRHFYFDNFYIRSLKRCNARRRYSIFNVIIVIIGEFIVMITIEIPHSTATSLIIFIKHSFRVLQSTNFPIPYFSIYLHSNVVFPGKEQPVYKIKIHTPMEEYQIRSIPP